MRYMTFVKEFEYMIFDIAYEQIGELERIFAIDDIHQYLVNFDAKVSTSTVNAIQDSDIYININWDNDKIITWLHTIGKEQHEDLFRLHKVDGKNIKDFISSQTFKEQIPPGHQVIISRYANL